MMDAANKVKTEIAFLTCDDVALRATVVRRGRELRIWENRDTHERLYCLDRPDGTTILRVFVK